MSDTAKIIALIKAIAGGSGGNEESGSNGGTMLVLVSYEGVLNRTWKEIHDALSIGVIPVIVGSLPNGGVVQYIVNAASYNGESISPIYTVYAISLGENNTIEFMTSSENGNPGSIQNPKA